jgi:hypothetical protein
MRDNATMKATTWRGAALVTAAVLLAACSALPLSESAAPAAAPVNYGVLVGNTLKGFKGYPGYSNFEISPPRRVHATTGWNWLTCVRYFERAQRRTYVFFMDNSTIVNSRYGVITDQCGPQQYWPFDPATGAVTTPAPAPVPQQPMGPAPTLQSPIY